MQEPLVRAETCHDPDNVTGTVPSRNPCTAERVHTNAGCASERKSIPQYGLGKSVKRIRISGQDTDETPSTSRLRTSENNGESYNRKPIYYVLCLTFI